MGKTIFEEIIVTGEDLLRQVKDLIRKGNIRRLMIKNNRGHVLLETSLTMGAAGIGGIHPACSVFVGSSLRCPDGHRSPHRGRARPFS